MRPIDAVPGLAVEVVLTNHRAPSGPAVMPVGPSMLGSVMVVSVPSVASRSMDEVV